MTIAAKFSRMAFERSANSQALADELARELTARVRQAAQPELEARAIIADLTRIGHALTSWDESTDFIIWGDDYMNPPSARRLYIHIKWHDDPREPDAAAFVDVAFDEWPKSRPETPLMCPKCALPLVSDSGSLFIKGHGGVDFEALPYKLELGALTFEGKVANRTIHRHAQLRRCKQCNGAWIPGGDST